MPTPTRSALTGPCRCQCGRGPWPRGGSPCWTAGSAPAAARLLCPAMKATTATTTVAAATPTHPHAGNPPETEDDDTPDLPPEEPAELSAASWVFFDVIEVPRVKKSKLSIMTLFPSIRPLLVLIIFPGIVTTILVLKSL